MDLAVCQVDQQSRYLTKHPKKCLKNIQISIAVLSHLVAADRTARDIPNFGPFSVVKIQVGAMPPLPHP